MIEKLSRAKGGGQERSFGRLGGLEVAEYCNSSHKLGAGERRGFAVLMVHGFR